MNKNNMTDYKYMVSTICFTYNHASYIEDALHGFSIQETNFPAVYIIIDDASTDGEQELLRIWAKENLQHNEDDSSNCKEMSYGELFFAKLVKKENVYFSILLLRENHYRKKSKLPYLSEWIDNSKYQALCEGDDYWINPQKLQMQVDFLESNPDYVMCHTDFGLSNGKWRNHKENLSKDDVYFPQCLFGMLQIGTLTTLYRLETYNNLPRLYMTKGWPMSDAPLWIEMAHEGKIKYFDTITANYRILPDSASHGSFEKEEKFADTALEIRQFYATHYGIDLPNNGYGKGYYITLMKIAFKHHRKDKANDYYYQAKQKGLLSKKTIVYYLATKFDLFGSFLRLIKG